MEEDLNVSRKAELILGGGILLPPGFVMPCRVSHSTAGPGAGSGSAVFAFGKHRVKKSISYESGEFELNIGPDGYFLTRNGVRFIDHITIEPVVYHCPEQAFFNLDQRCMFNCAYCASPRLDRNDLKNLTDDAIIEMLKNVIGKQKVISVSLTSGVVGSVGETVGRFVSCIKRIRSEFPGIPIGVEPYVTGKEHILALKEAGADEIKINIETPDREIFAKVCPELDFDGIMKNLDAATDIFGKGKVSSNIIYGMGENDDILEKTMDDLASKGIIPTLRALRYSKYNRDPLMSAIGKQPDVTPQRAIALAHMQKRILEKHGLTTTDCHTMCLECTCCDLVPFRDL